VEKQRDDDKKMNAMEDKTTNDMERLTDNKKEESGRQ